MTNYVERETMAGLRRAFASIEMALDTNKLEMDEALWKHNKLKEERGKLTDQLATIKYLLTMVEEA